MLKKLSLLAAAGAFTTFLVPAANALTPAPLSTPTDVIQVAQGCGPGWHRGRGGRCRPNVYRGGPRCRWVRTVYGPRRVCR